MPKVIYETQDGVQHNIDVEEGITLMEVIVLYQLGLMPLKEMMQV